MWMSNFKYILLTICFLLLAFPLKALEYIENFHSDIMVNPDGSLNIEETITVHHEGIKIKRGIFRDLSTSKGESYKILNVMRNGAPEPWFTEKLGYMLRLNTGDDKFLESPTTSTYTINYIMYDALRPIKDESLNELYLNITGKWDFPIKHLTAEVRYPPDTGVTRQYGYQTNRPKQEYIPDKPFQFFNLAPNEQATIAQAFTQGTVNIPLPKTYRLLILSFLLMLIYYLIAWRIWGKDPAPKAIVPDWEAPKDLSPLECAFINENGQTPNNAFFLHILWLLQQKVINILENKSSGFMGQKTMYTLTTAEKPEISNKEMQMYCDNFPNVLTITSTRSERLADYQQNLTDQLSKKLEKKYYHKRNMLTAIGALIMPLTCLYLFPSTAPLLLWVFCIIAAPAIYSKNMWPSIFIAVIATPVMYSYLTATGDYIWPAVFYGYFILIVIFAHLMFQPTFIGQRQKEKIEGLKMFLKAVSNPDIEQPETADDEENNTERKTLLSNKKRLTPKDMDNLFPYAIALRLEKEWSKKYADIFGYATVAKNTHNLWFQPKFQTNFSQCCKTSAPLQQSSLGLGSSGRGCAGGGFGGGGGGGR